MDKKDKKIEHLENQIIGLKVRVRRLEDFISSFPDPHNYISTDISDLADELLPDALDLALTTEKISATDVQRRLSVGYARAASLLDQLESIKVVDSANDSGRRKVLFTDKERKMLSEARKVIKEYDRASASLLQRKLSIGYAQAAKLINILEAEGSLGPAIGSKPRQVLM